MKESISSSVSISHSPESRSIQINTEKPKDTAISHSPESASIQINTEKPKDAPHKPSIIAQSTDSDDDIDNDRTFVQRIQDLSQLNATQNANRNLKDNAMDNAMDNAGEDAGNLWEPATYGQLAGSKKQLSNSPSIEKKKRKKGSP